MLGPSPTRLLLVDDDPQLRALLCSILENGGFEVHFAATVNEALKLINSQEFEVLISDLHMPGPGDGLTVVSAIRHANPEAVTLILSAYPEMSRAAAAIVAQADDVLVKPGAMANIAALVRERLRFGTAPARTVSSLATILDEAAAATIQDWLVRVLSDRPILAVAMSDQERTAHLPQLFADLIYRLKYPQPLGSRALVSPAAALHGQKRWQQGYTAAMIVEESRMLQVSIFQALQNNLQRVNFSLILLGVMEIADEVDSQLAQAMTGYAASAMAETLPTNSYLC